MKAEELIAKLSEPCSCGRSHNAQEELRCTNCDNSRLDRLLAAIEQVCQERDEAESSVERLIDYSRTVEAQLDEVMRGSAELARGKLIAEAQLAAAEQRESALIRWAKVYFSDLHPSIETAEDTIQAMSRERSERDAALADVARAHDTLRTLYTELRRLSAVAQEPISTVGACLRRIDERSAALAESEGKSSEPPSFTNYADHDYGCALRVRIDAPECTCSRRTA